MDTRQRVRALLQARPALAPADAARELGVDPSTALYHLRRLVREGAASAHGPPRRRRYCAAGRRAPQDPADSRGVLDAVRAAPGIARVELAARLRLARSTLGWHLGRLQRRGLVRYERKGRRVLVYPTDA